MLLKTGAFSSPCESVRAEIKLPSFPPLFSYTLLPLSYFSIVFSYIIVFCSKKARKKKGKMEGRRKGGRKEKKEEKKGDIFSVWWIKSVDFFSPMLTIIVVKNVSLLFSNLLLLTIICIIPFTIHPRHTQKEE